MKEHTLLICLEGYLLYIIKWFFCPPIFDEPVIVTIQKIKIWQSKSEHENHYYIVTSNFIFSRKCNTTVFSHYHVLLIIISDSMVTVTRGHKSKIIELTVGPYLRTHQTSMNYIKGGQVRLKSSLETYYPSYYGIQCLFLGNVLLNCILFLS